MTLSGVDISNKPSPHSLRNKIGRILWAIVQATIFRLIPRPLHAARARILRAFGANVSPKARVCPRVRIWAPWNLTMGEYATLADGVDCYCVAPITVGSNTTISQYTYLCGATHDHKKRNFPLVPKPIVIGADCWIAADCFIGPGVTIGRGTVVGARSGVFKDLPEWKICVGTPAEPIADRVLEDADS